MNKYDMKYTMYTTLYMALTHDAEHDAEYVLLPWYPAAMHITLSDISYAISSTTVNIMK